MTDPGEGLKPHLSRAQHFALPGEASAHNLVDFVLLEVLNACLGYVDYFSRMRSLLPTAGALVVDETERVVAGRLVVQIVTNLREALALEASIEDERVTPDNALTQFVARALATESIDEVEQLLSYLEAEIWPWVIEIGGSSTWAAGAALSRATELTEKIGSMVGSARHLLDSCEAAHIERDDRWPDTETTHAEKRAKALIDRLEIPVARLATAVDAAPDSDRPDHFGWAYYRAHENILRRVLTLEPGDPAELRQKVVLLYVAGDIATGRLLATVRRHDQGVINSYVGEPYLRFLQLSGIALALSEVAEAPALFRPFESLWAGLLADASHATPLLARAAATLSSEFSVFGLTPGGIERTEIEMRANRALDELGVHRDVFDRGGFGSAGRGEGAVALSDKAARLLGVVRSSHFEGMFYACWLRPCALAVGASVPAEVERYLHLLDLDAEDESDG